MKIIEKSIAGNSSITVLALLEVRSNELSILEWSLIIKQNSHGTLSFQVLFLMSMNNIKYLIFSNTL